MIVACAKPQNVNYSSFSSQPSQPNYNEQFLAKGGWKCSCGRVHASYVFSCSCGMSKSEVQADELKKKQEEEKRKAETMDESSKVSAIKEYKELMDAGIISHEEFEAKKKQLLGL